MCKIIKLEQNIEYFYYKIIIEILIYALKIMQIKILNIIQRYK
jgi:hypothetical protein